ncbi:PBECR4 domain-containing protein [Paenibacillus terrae]
MLDLTTLLSLNKKPNFADIDLPVLRELFYKELYPYTFEFILSTGETITLKFDLNKFCHLVGIEKTAKQQRTLRGRQLKEYKGMRGLNNIFKGVLNKASIRNLGVNLNPMKDKMLHFYFLPRLMNTSSLMIKYVPSTTSALSCEFFIYDLHSPDNAYIQLGLQKEWHGKWYYPESFLVNRITAANPTNKQAAPPSHTVSIVARHRYEREEKSRFKEKRLLHQRRRRTTRRSKHNVTRIYKRAT